MLATFQLSQPAHGLEGWELLCWWRVLNDQYAYAYRRSESSILISTDSAEARYVLLCLIAIGQEHILLLQPDSGAAPALPYPHSPFCMLFNMLHDTKYSLFLL